MRRPCAALVTVALIVENSLDVTRVVMEYLTKKLPNVVVAMSK